MRIRIQKNELMTQDIPGGLSLISEYNASLRPIQCFKSYTEENAKERINMQRHMAPEKTMMYCGGRNAISRNLLHVNQQKTLLLYSHHHR